MLLLYLQMVSEHILLVLHHILLEPAYNQKSLLILLLGLDLSHWDHNSCLQYQQRPQLILNGITTVSPTLTSCTPEPVSSITPMNSCPRVCPGSMPTTVP